MSNIEEAILNPAEVYDQPASVLSDDRLSQAQKIEILRRWEYDARELEVAAEENMCGGKPDILDEVLDALREVEDNEPDNTVSPTKQGGM